MSAIAKLIQDMWQWMSEQVQTFIELFTPLTIIYRMAEYLSGSLPLPDTRPALIFNQFQQLVVQNSHWITILDYFINLPFFMVLLSLMMAFQILMFSVRIWRFIKTFVN